MKIIDSHIHLSTLEHQNYLKWHGDHPLHKNCRLEEYFSQFQDDRFQIDGVVAIEFDPQNDMTSIEGCKGSLEEYDYLSNIIKGQLTEAEGSNEYSNKLKVMIPHAPMPKGPQFLQQYVDEMKKHDKDTFVYVKGFRYLVQDKPPGTMTKKLFIESLKWLDQNDFVFDWGIDLRRGGFWQFDETIEVVKQVPNLKYVINHLTKPSYKAEDLQKWAAYMKTIYELTPNSFMKLSGGFSELDSEILGDLPQCADRIFPWFKVCMDLWGVERIIWASNWPVCAMFGGTNVVSRWFTVTELLFDRINLSRDDRQRIYSENYLNAYNVEAHNI